jgi:hypothetical protein
MSSQNNTPDFKEYYEDINKRAGKNADVIIGFINKYIKAKCIPNMNDTFFHMMIGNKPITYIASNCIDIHNFIITNYKNYTQILEYIYSFDNDFSHIIRYLFENKEDLLLNVSHYQLVNFINSYKGKEKILLYLINNAKENRMKKIKTLIGNNPQ